MCAFYCFLNLDLYFSPSRLFFGTLPALVCSFFSFSFFPGISLLPAGGARKRPKEAGAGAGDPPTPLSKCPLSGALVPCTSLESGGAGGSKDALPMCVVTGNHILREDFCLCPRSAMPAIYSEYLRSGTCRGIVAELLVVGLPGLFREMGPSLDGHSRALNAGVSPQPPRTALFQRPRVSVVFVRLCVLCLFPCRALFSCSVCFFRYIDDEVRAGIAELPAAQEDKKQVRLPGGAGLGPGEAVIQGGVTALDPVSFRKLERLKRAPP